MHVALAIFTGAIASVVLSSTQAFVFSGASSLSRRRTPGVRRVVVSAKPRVPGCLGYRYTTAWDERASSVWVTMTSAASAGEGEGGDGDPSTGVSASASAKDVVGGGAPASKPVEPVGASGAVDDELLMKLVGQDYGMMALLRNDKFKGLIVLLRNIPPNEWVAEVARAYPDDDEVKGMLGKVGKLMHMMDYYESKKPKM